MNSNSRDTKVLGVGGSSHDFSSAILVNGEIKVAIEDERLDRVRHGLQTWHNSPSARSAKYCLEALSLQEHNLDAIYINEDLESTRSLFGNTPIKMVPHHLAHAAATFYPSPFERAALLVIDGHGGPVGNSKAMVELETVSIGTGIGETVNVQPLQTGKKHLTSGHWHYITSNSLGSFYKVITDTIGFGMRGQGKTMGLAPYGDSDSLQEELSAYASVNSDGQFEFDPYSGIYDWALEKLKLSSNPFRIRANIAAAAQAIFETSLIRIASKCHEITGMDNICYGGGCALNGSANHRILHDTPFKRIYIYPAAGDSGLAIGAAYLGYFRDLGGKRRPGVKATPYLGRRYSVLECEQELNCFPVHYRKPAGLVCEIAQRLCQSEVLAVFRGSSEIGPRALGNRSIIADPRSTAIRDHINISIKERETFRPLAPMVPIEWASKFFELDQPSPFMLLIAKVKDEYRSILAGVCHVDGTARVQTVDRESNPFLHDLLNKYGEMTGIPVLMNTSFNGKGEPIVETPNDALRCFLRLPLNTLLMEEFVVEKHTPWAKRYSWGQKLSPA